MDGLNKRNYKDYVLAVANLELPWDKLCGCNILITGAAGLIGSCITDVLMSRKNRNFHIYASGRNANKIRDRFTTYLNEDLFHVLQYDVTAPVPCNVDFDYIIHAASNASPNYFYAKPVEVMKSNIIGICNLLDYGKEHKLRRFMYISTGEVYGEGDGRIFDESYSGYVDCVKPRSCYPSSKRAAETLCVSYASEYGVDVVIARPCHTYGPHFTKNDNRVYAQFIRNVLQNEDIVMKSTGEQFRSWSYVTDCVSGIMHILLKGQNGEAYNIADESSNISIRDLAEMIASIGGKKVIIDVPESSEKAGYNVVKKSVFSTSKLQSLGWKIHGCMKEKIESTISDAQSTYCQSIDK